VSRGLTIALSCGLLITNVPILKLIPHEEVGSMTGVRVLAELIHAAEYRGVTTYQDIAVIMGLPLQGAYMGRETGHVLGEFSEDEVNAGRPMLSAVAVMGRRPAD